MSQAAKLSLHLPTAGGLDPSEPQTRQRAYELSQRRVKTWTGPPDRGRDRDPGPLCSRTPQVLGRGPQGGPLPHPLTPRWGSCEGSDAQFSVTWDGLLRAPWFFDSLPPVRVSERLRTRGHQGHPSARRQLVHQLVSSSGGRSHGARRAWTADQLLRGVGGERRNHARGRAML